MQMRQGGHALDPQLIMHELAMASLLPAILEVLNVVHSIPEQPPF